MPIRRVAHLEDNGVNAGTKIAAWEVTDIATTDLATGAFGSNQFLHRLTDAY